MIRYSINTLERLSGIKAHTLRIWEKRYQILQPDRTATNIRYYSDEQLKKLLNIVTLLDHGYRISKVSQLSPRELVDAVSKVLDNPENSADNKAAYINQLIAAGLCFDISRFEQLLKKASQHFEEDEVYSAILQPMMLKIGLMWTRNKMSPAQEHFISHLVRQKIMAAIEAVPLEEKGREKWLLFLPPDEYHDIGLLYGLYLLRKNKRPVIYLGGNVPTSELGVVAQYNQPTHALFFMLKNMTETAGAKYLDEVRAALPDTQLLVAGNNKLLEKIIQERDLVWLHNPAIFKQLFLD